MTEAKHHMHAVVGGSEHFPLKKKWGQRQHPSYCHVAHLCNCSVRHLPCWRRPGLTAERPVKRRLILPCDDAVDGLEGMNEPSSAIIPSIARLGSGGVGWLVHG